MRKPVTMSLFCGAGGEMQGKLQAFAELGIQTESTVGYALNHWDEAIQTARQNFPGIECRREAIEEVTAADFGLAGQTINMLWASPSCVHFSTARGGKPVSDQQRSHAQEVVDRFLKVADVKVLLMENVPEFRDWGPLHKDHSGGCKGRPAGAKRCPVKSCHFEKPIKARKGEFFAAFILELRGLGYEVEHRVLCAADYGDPTIRRRFFLQAVKDGIPIRWPEATHRNPKKPAGLFDAALPPWRTAAECIDFTLPCPSIFDRKKPLAEKTLKRIAAGIERFVLTGEPFIVNLTHGGRVEALDEPMKTVTGAQRGEKALAAPCLVGVGGRAGQSEPRGADQPIGTVTTKADSALVAVSMVRTDMHKSNATCAYSAEEPLRTVSTGGGHAVVEAAFIAKHYTGVVGAGVDTPMPTVTSKDHNSLVAATLVQTGYGEREGQAPRALNIEEPLGTVVACGQKHALVAALLEEKLGAAHLVGIDQASSRSIWPADAPLSTATTKARHAVVAASIARLNGECTGSPMSEPIGALAANGQHYAMVAAFLQRYGAGDRPEFYTHPLDDPMRTQDTKDRFALVTVTIQGQEFVLADIGLRMLQPRELARAMGLPDTFSFRRPDGSELKKGDQVKMIGNMCPVHTVQALVRTIVEDRRAEFGVAA